MEGNKTLAGVFFNWWYHEAFTRFLAYIKKYFAYLSDYFSVMACLNTLFYPWKRDQIGYEGLGLKERFEALVMNLTSRLIGAIVKLFVLSAFLFSSGALAVISAVGIILWYLYPAVLIGLIFLSFYGLK